MLPFLGACLDSSTGDIIIFDLRLTLFLLHLLTFDTFDAVGVAQSIERVLPLLNRFLGISTLKLFEFCFRIAFGLGDPPVDVYAE